MTLSHLISERNSIETQISSIKSTLQNLPKGELLCCSNGKYSKWYLKNQPQSIYLSKKNRALAEQLAFKKYQLTKFHELKYTQHLLDITISKLQKLNLNSLKLLQENSFYKPLLDAYFKSCSDSLQTWWTASYLQNQAHSEHLLHNTLTGHKVRSKSEAMIANTLYLNQIPYRYECLL